MSRLCLLLPIIFLFVVVEVDFFIFELFVSRNGRPRRSAYEYHTCGVRRIRDSWHVLYLIDRLLNLLSFLGKLWVLIEKARAEVEMRCRSTMPFNGTRGISEEEEERM
mmetsp:Transcript_54681/g.158245  ORF Transcript_54681/g.158245 Transcript_54681/m.158245 type:complete len:108 (-) Transcript_54681:105-428(-)